MNIRDQEIPVLTLSIFKRYGTCISWSIFLLMNVIWFAPLFYHYHKIESMKWTFSHCLQLGHETIIRTVFLLLAVALITDFGLFWSSETFM